MNLVFLPEILSAGGEDQDRVARAVLILRSGFASRISQLLAMNKEGDATREVVSLGSPQNLSEAVTRYTSLADDLMKQHVECGNMNITYSYIIICSISQVCFITSI